MSSYEEQQLKKLESDLAALAPRPAALDRDRLLFEAGRRSVRPTMFWPLTTLVMTAVAALLTVALFSSPARPPISPAMETPVRSVPSDSVRPPLADVDSVPATPESSLSPERK